MSNFRRQTRRRRAAELQAGRIFQFCLHKRCRCEPHNAVRAKHLDVGVGPWPLKCLQCGRVTSIPRDERNRSVGLSVLPVLGRTFIPAAEVIVRAHGGWNVKKKNGHGGWFRWLPLSEVVGRQRQGELIKVAR